MINFLPAVEKMRDTLRECATYIHTYLTESACEWIRFDG